MDRDGGSELTDAEVRGLAELVGSDPSHPALGRASLLARGSGTDPSETSG